ncbi:hypothetical protein [Nocardia aurantia]|uniref:DUF308 domain-containing protein n=1 Tax=Nocardia aurantia TaxID=2585199 RepID=A0A7K0DVQ2_9NOCA|nr:hypothetical protein [Nocardia aurantia]MQY29863.1 hypothetical protein [Nocardia aurantia]
MTTTITMADTTFAKALRRLYLTRFAFAFAWAGLVFATAAMSGPLLTILLVIYPLFDAGAVVWQLRAEKEPQRSRDSAWTNAVVSVAVAVALGVASTIAISAALAVWGAWAIGSGIPQLITAIRNRRSGGQVAQMLSGGISVFAGAGFLVQGLRGAENITGAAGYAALGGIFFLISAGRLATILRKAAA